MPLLATLDRSFVEGDADLMATLLADDVVLYWNEQPTITGREEVHNAFAALFEAFDSSAWKADHHTVEVHEAGAYVLSDFTESLLPYDGSAGMRVKGRGVFFWRRSGDTWLITRMLSARSAPNEPIVPDG